MHKKKNLIEKGKAVKYLMNSNVLIDFVTSFGKKAVKCFHRISPEIYFKFSNVKAGGQRGGDRGTCVSIHCYSQK